MQYDPVRVIVVDDLSDAADTLAMPLELDGYSVRIAYSGSDALNQVVQSEPHCILFDIDMPGIDGFQLAKQVRDRHGDDVVLIAVTAREKQDSRVSGAFAMADHYLIKPVTCSRPVWQSLVRFRKRSASCC